MANIDKTVERIENDRIKQDLIIANAKLASIAFVKLSQSGTHYVFADKNGNNVFEGTDMFKKEFGFPIAENDNEVTFIIKGSDDGDMFPLVVPKVGEIAVGSNKPNGKYLEVLVKTSIAPLPVKEKRRARAARAAASQNAASKQAVNK